MTCVRQPQRLSFLLGQVLVCTQYSLLYAFRLFTCDVQFFLVVWYAIVSILFFSLYTCLLYGSASMPSFFYAHPLSALASMPSLLRLCLWYALASQPPPLASAACCCSTVFYLSCVHACWSLFLFL
ncbi:uncharacterized protein EI90DRAFT_3086068 [Cantharellus anzutake]|uniref:uncharacterized protein n=1 Tax=Cantharellus anzutake TaxID=1750568 RepID=UPI00190864ED|nr:uncharacterized protein EI90DRAFT_3086068 [Cantharellus anzutake]KAF8316692.1 hypothetical protein EI90DRAFT_3086068 [Cantharellus anzutake]